jgi:V/A-type H+-transporting ATPase subunit I
MAGKQSMFRPLPMKHIQLQVLTEDLPQASMALAELELFNPDFRPVEVEDFPEIPGESYRELYHQACSRLEKIRKHVGLAPTPRIEGMHVISEQELAKTNDWLGQVCERCSSFEETFRQISDQERQIAQLHEVLDNFMALKIDLSLLQGEKRFLDLHIGMLPRENLPQLREAVELAGYFIFTYMDHGSSQHVIVLGPKGRREAEIRSVLDTAGFHPLTIPPELHDRPEAVRSELVQRQQELKAELMDHQEAMEACGNELRTRLEQCRGILLLAQPYVSLETSARSAGALSIISGWVPARDVKRIRAALDHALDNPYNLELRNPKRDERPLVPSYLPKNRLIQPFHTLVKQYGIPRYGEIDPTAIFALTFVSMFGMMFGDIGHGLVIMAAAIMLRKTLKSFTPFAVLAGLSATVFGFLYGSIFGYEEILHALWIPPLSDPLYMLSMALMWGIAFLLIITMLSIHNRLAEGEVSRAIFDTNGLVSITLYLAVLAGLYRVYNSGEFGLPAAIVGILSLLALLSYKVIETHATPGERMLVAAIETFETLTGYISNTLSFLRVAAFSLNHVALAIAVFTLADMMDGTGHWIMVIFGNLFILILEGAIVTIQALRLEYYEGFSRFYSGDGQEFKPLKLGGGGVA